MTELSNKLIIYQPDPLHQPYPVGSLFLSNDDFSLTADIKFCQTVEAHSEQALLSAVSATEAG